LLVSWFDGCEMSVANYQKLCFIRWHKFSSRWSDCLHWEVHFSLWSFKCIIECVLCTLVTRAGVSLR